jgi:hypothetical protein
MDENTPTTWESLFYFIITIIIILFLGEGGVGYKEARRKGQYLLTFFLTT